MSARKDHINALQQEIDRTNEKVFYFMELTNDLLERNERLTAAVLAAVSPTAARLVLPKGEPAEPKDASIGRPVGM